MGRQRLLLYHARDLSTAAQPSPSVVDVVDLVKVGWVELVRRDQRRKDALSARDRKRLARKKQSSLLAIEPCRTRGKVVSVTWGFASSQSKSFASHGHSPAQFTA